MEPIRNTIERVIQNWQVKHRNEEGLYEDFLKRFLTKQEQRHIRSLSLKDSPRPCAQGRGSQLILNIDSSAWLYLLNLKKRQLLKNLKQILKSNNEEAVNEIILRLDTNYETKKQIKG